jgi:4-phytase/acid phosphatase
MAVALFRHGVRAPLGDLDKGRNSLKPWPTMKDWGVDAWGHVTAHGLTAVRALGGYYARRYNAEWKQQGFRAYVFADADDRTRETASALVAGLHDVKGIQVKLASFNGDVDPLFHPFKAGVGNSKIIRPLLKEVADDIGRNADRWWSEPNHADAIAKLRSVLACPKPLLGGCRPIDQLTESVAPCDHYVKEDCESPIHWKGKFSTASTATEAFLLEYSNAMPREQVGWNHAEPSQLGTMLALHEFYFDQTQRHEYPAQIDGSNLVREIRSLLNGGQGCRVPRGQQFVALVGHDTNIANVGGMLRLKWTVPSDDTGTLPAKDALPAGALVFELRRLKGEDYVRVVYMAQSPKQSRDAAGDVVRVNVSCLGLDTCRIPLSAFSRIMEHFIDPSFLSACPGVDPPPARP